MTACTRIHTNAGNSAIESLVSYMHSQLSCMDAHAGAEKFVFFHKKLIFMHAGMLTQTKGSDASSESATKRKKKSKSSKKSSEL